MGMQERVLEHVRGVRHPACSCHIHPRPLALAARRGMHHMRMHAAPTRRSIHLTLPLL